MIKNFKVTELSGGLLDFLVARAFYPKKSVYFEDSDECCLLVGQAEEIKLITYQPSKKWLHGGPVIDEHNISVYVSSELACTPEVKRNYCATSSGEKLHFADADTYLEAVMRCYLLEKLGENVQIDISKDFSGSRSDYEQTLVYNYFSYDQMI